MKCGKPAFLFFSLHISHSGFHCGSRRCYSCCLCSVALQWDRSVHSAPAQALINYQEKADTGVSSVLARSRKVVVCECVSVCVFVCVSVSVYSGGGVELAPIERGEERWGESLEYQSARVVHTHTRAHTGTTLTSGKEVKDRRGATCPLLPPLHASACERVLVCVCLHVRVTVCVWVCFFTRTCFYVMMCY